MYLGGEGPNHAGRHARGRHQGLLRRSPAPPAPPRRKVADSRSAASKSASAISSYASAPWAEALADGRERSTPLEALASYAIGTMEAPRAAIRAIGAAYAKVAHIQLRHGVKQADRFLSNPGIDVEPLRVQVLLDEDVLQHGRDALPVQGSHGRATNQSGRSAATFLPRHPHAPDHFDHPRCRHAHETRGSVRNAITFADPWPVDAAEMRRP